MCFGEVYTHVLVWCLLHCIHITIDLGSKGLILNSGLCLKLPVILEHRPHTRALLANSITWDAWSSFAKKGCGH